MKKVLFSITLLFTVYISCFNAYAIENTDISFKINTNNYNINGMYVTSEKSYIAGSGTTLAPVRIIAEAFGINVQWNGTTNTVTLTSDDTEISLQINNISAIVNEKNRILDVPPALSSNGVTMLPIRFIAENFGLVVEYNADNNSIHIYKRVITYSNLNSPASQTELEQTFSNAGISENNINTVLKWIVDYNECMKQCKAFSLIGDFITNNDSIVDYGDYYVMSKSWYQEQNRKYDDILCRIAAFELNNKNIKIDHCINQTEWACSEDEWLCSDLGCINNNPLIDWNDDIIGRYFTLFNPIQTNTQCNGEQIYHAIKSEWSNRGISFGNEDYSLITMWTNSDDMVVVVHAATLVDTENGYLLFEKTNPQSPYSAAKFKTISDVKAYLYEMTKSDYEKYQLELGDYVILQNDTAL